MKRRDFSRTAGAAVLAAPALWPLQIHAQSGKFVEGTDYVALDSRAPTEAPAGKVEVVEFFWYSCPHCNAFEPTLAEWIKRLPKDVYFRRVPIAFRDDFVPQQRLHYSLEAMGLVDKLHSKVFAAIHGEKQNLARGEAIIEWVAKQGVDKAKFSEAFNSFSVATKATKATQLQNAYRVEGVPALGVGGRFYLDGTLTRGMERGLQVVESLVAGLRGAK